MSEQTSKTSAPVTKDDAAHYTKTTDVNRKSTETVNGDQVDFTVSDTTTTDTVGRFDKHVNELIQGVLQEREARENERANKRNFNRVLTLVLTIVIGIAVVYTLPMLGHTGKVLAPFAFCITVSMDLLVTGWAYIRHY